MNLKKYAAALALFLCACLAFAQYALEVKTNRMDALYNQGEAAVFNITVSENGEPVPDATVKWNFSKDGVEPFIDAGELELQDGAGHVSGTLDEPGFLRCTVTYQPPSGKAITVRAGAGFDPLEIRQSREAPADFDAFWDAQRRLLETLPLNLKLTEVPSHVPGVVSYDLQADCGEIGISAFFSMPKDAKAKSCPAIVRTHGAGVRGASLGNTTEWAKEGFIAIDFNVHGLPNNLSNEEYLKLYKTTLRDYFQKGRESRETHFFRGLYTRLMRVLNLITSRPEWDGKTLVVWGGSQGGAQAFAASGLDPRVSLFCAEIPAMCDLTGVTADRVNGWPTNRNYPTPSNRPQDMTEDELKAAQYFDSANFASRAKGEAFVTIGFADNVCPPTTCFAAYNAIRSPKRLHAMPLVWHKSTDEGRASIRLAILEHAAKMRGKN